MGSLQHGGLLRRCTVAIYDPARVLLGHTLGFSCTAACTRHDIAIIFDCDVPSQDYLVYSPPCGVAIKVTPRSHTFQLSIPPLTSLPLYPCVKPDLPPPLHTHTYAHTLGVNYGPPIIGHPHTRYPLVDLKAAAVQMTSEGAGRVHSGGARQWKPVPIYHRG